MIDCLNSALYNLKRSAIREFSQLAKNKEGCISLTLGEPDFNTLDVIKNQVCSSLDNNETHYIENNGLITLREKIASFEREKNKFECTKDQVIVTSGATEALFVALFGILNPDDEVIVLSPAFVLYEEIIKLCRAKTVYLDLTKNNFQVSESSLRKLVNEKTKAIIINSPNNPTGTILNKASLDAIYNVVKENKIFVLCDDVYRQLIYTDDYHSFTEYNDVKDKIFLIQSFSKPYAMTGWRMGYLIAPQIIKERLELVHQFLVVSTPSLFQKACIKALDCDISLLKDTYKKRRTYMLKRLNDMGLEVPPAEGAFYMFPSIARFNMSSSEFCRKMIEEASLAATPGFCFGSDDHIRLTYCYSDNELEEGLNRLESFIKKLETK